MGNLEKSAGFLLGYIRLKPPVYTCISSSFIRVDVFVYLGGASLFFRPPQKNAHKLVACWEENKTHVCPTFTSVLKYLL